MEPVETLRATHLPARDIPVPRLLSPEARQVLGAESVPFAVEHFPSLEDKQGWRNFADTCNQAMIDLTKENAPADAPEQVTLEELDLDGVTVFRFTPLDWEPRDHRVLLEIHGGGFVFGSGECLKLQARGIAERHKVRTWSVDYRMPPDFPFPTPLDDCVTVYRALLREHRPEDIIMIGGSGGANLIAALLLRGRDEGLPMPAAAALLIPAVDLTCAGDSWNTNLGLDNVLTGDASLFGRLYAGDHDLSDPYLSPVYGEFMADFPPCIITSGTRELMLSSAVVLHRKLRAAGVAAELHLKEAAGHGGFFGKAPEDEELDQEVDRFVAAHWAR